MIILDLYIDGEKVEQFGDSSVTVKDSIKKSSDIGSVFTSYSQQFTLPASKTNNKIFKHYYNVKVEDGFDSRRKHSALLKLNGADYKKGYIKINGVDLKNNKAHAYRVQFFGEITSLKDKLGESLIEDLFFLNLYNHEYSLDNVRDGFEQGLTVNGFTGTLSQDADGEICYPFITHTRGFKYDSNGLYDITEGGTPALADRLDHTDLKPAIKVKTVLAAIAYHFGLTFAGDFIESTMFNELFLWCHREKGGLKNGSENDNLNFYKTLDDGTGVNEYSLDSGTEQRVITTQSLFNQAIVSYTATFEVATADPGTYEMNISAIPSNGGFPLHAQLQGVTGNNSLELTIEHFAPNSSITWEVITTVYSEDTVSNITPTLTVEQFLLEASQGSGVYGANAVNLVKDVVVTNNLPKMKCIDFMRTLFKMFNLVAYEQPINNFADEYQIVLQPLDDYYDSGSALDITEYIDIESSSVERIQPYHLLKFEYPEPSTYLAINANEINRTEFGNAKFNTQDLQDSEDSLLFDGGEYTVEVGLEKMMYERITNGTTDALTQIQWGWAVNDFTENTPEPELGKPLFFYKKSRSCSTDVIKWSDDTNTTTTYNAPSNVNSDETQTLNFGAEIDEYELATNENSLFQNFYSRYVRALYDVNARRIIVTAYFPPSVIFNYKLNDKFIINATAFNIEDLSIDLYDGKAQIELLKITGREEAYVVITDDCYSVFEYVVDDYWCRPYTPPTSEGTVLTDSLNSYYKFNNSDVDSKGTNHGNTTGVDSFVDGISNQAKDLNGTTDYMTVPAADSITFLDGIFSVSMNVKFDASGSVETILSKRDQNTSFEWDVKKNASDKIAFTLYTDASNYIGITGGTALSIDTWYRVVVTSDDSDTEGGLNIYIDDVLETPSSASAGTYTGMADNTLDLSIGKQDLTGTEQYMNGKIDGLGIWGIELTQDNVDTIGAVYASGNELI